MLIISKAGLIGVTTQLLNSVLNKLDKYDPAQITDENILKELAYLENKELIVVKFFDNKQWQIKRTSAHITARGTDFIEGELDVAGVDLDG